MCSINVNTISIPYVTKHFGWKDMLLTLILLAWTLLACVVPASAQSITSGDVSGVVIDPANAAIPNASVTLTNVNKSITQRATTSEQGSYRFAFLQPGTYSVSVSAPGFAAQERGGIAVSAGQPTAASFRLEVAGASTTVVVSETGSALQTENADVATSYDAETVQNMPNPGGDITYIAQTTPGV